jgi:hypothetical protein
MTGVAILAPLRLSTNPTRSNKIPTMRMMSPIVDCASFTVMDALAVVREEIPTMNAPPVGTEKEKVPLVPVWTGRRLTLPEQEPLASRLEQVPTSTEMAELELQATLAGTEPVMETPVTLAM